MITSKQIEELANHPDVRRIAVQNFLGSLQGSTKLEATLNLAQDARDYKWNAATTKAIRRGIDLHFTA